MENLPSPAAGQDEIASAQTVAKDRSKTGNQAEFASGIRIRIGFGQSDPSRPRRSRSSAMGVFRGFLDSGQSGIAVGDNLN